MDMPGFACSVPQETRLFLLSCLLGIPLGLLFDVFRTLRALLPHCAAAVFIEDALFSLSGCVLLQLFASAFAEDTLRWYYALGAVLGLLLWLLTVGAVWMRMIAALRNVLRRVGALPFRIGRQIRLLFARNKKTGQQNEKNEETT